MINEFEKLPQIAERLDDGWISFRDGVYWNKCLQRGDDYSNGALYAYQEQQKKIDAALARIDKECDKFCETHDMDKVALLESIESILK